MSRSKTYPPQPRSPEAPPSATPTQEAQTPAAGPAASGNLQPQPDPPHPEQPGPQRRPIGLAFPTSQNVLSDYRELRELGKTVHPDHQVEHQARCAQVRASAGILQKLETVQILLERGLRQNADDPDPRGRPFSLTERARRNAQGGQRGR